MNSGDVCSLVPGKILNEIGVEIQKEMSFLLEDGTSIKKRISSAYFEFEGEGGPALVVYGEEKDTVLLGATTLLSIGLDLCPFYKTLHLIRITRALC